MFFVIFSVFTRLSRASHTVEPRPVFGFSRPWVTCLSILLGLFMGAMALPDSASVDENLPSGSLDTASLRKLYLDGDLEKVAASLEAWRAKGMPGGHADSVFTYRHLGIIYASSEENQVRAESYLNLLLNLEPDIDILDPIVSPSVDAFWERVRTRHNKVTGHRPKTAQGSLSSSASSTQSSRHKTQFEDEKTFPWMWATLGTVVVGGAVGIYLWDQSRSNSPSKSEPVLDTADFIIKVKPQP